MSPQDESSQLLGKPSDVESKASSTPESSSSSAAALFGKSMSTRAVLVLFGVSLMALVVGLVVNDYEERHYAEHEQQKKAEAQAEAEADAQKEAQHKSEETLLKEQKTGPYTLVERQNGKDFFQYYDFFDGPDSLGSAGYNVYVGQERAMELGIANITQEKETDESFVYMSSRATADGGPRESVRLEGKRRYNSGLFILDVRHMPAGCGQWPAFWLTDEKNWPDNGEIDIVEGVNEQTAAKTALHTSDRCDMYAHVSPFEKTGYWDSATGIPNTWTGKPDMDTKVESDNCWNMAAHQWANQGCVMINDKDNTIGTPMNIRGGGVYALEWDPVNLRIRSWVFPFHDESGKENDELPDNLSEILDTVNQPGSAPVEPDTDAWGLPYGYFAVGPTTGCSSEHFQNMRIVFNLAFCGAVSGNRFFGDCPAQAEQFNIDYNPIATCNAYIASNPEELSEAYWKVGGVYVYERS